MGNVAIFKDKNAVVSTRKRELSDLSKSLMQKSTVTNRRIQVQPNGTFKRVVNGEQIGNAVRGEINVILVHMLEKVSRIFYKSKFDPNKEATLPNCWSNLGDKPEEASSDKQSTNCLTCPQNVKGSGEGGGRACRFQRRISVILEGDDSGEVYQLNIPAKSLFGKGVGNVHPFESYIKYLLANHESLDNVVTNVAFDPNADTMELVFTPVRHLTDDEYDLVKQAQMTPEAKMYTAITVAQADGVKKLPKQEAKIERSDEPDDDEIEEPQVRPSKKATEEAPKEKKAAADIVDEWLAE